MSVPGNLHICCWEAFLSYCFAFASLTGFPKIIILAVIVAKRRENDQSKYHLKEIAHILSSTCTGNETQFNIDDNLL